MVHDGKGHSDNSSKISDQIWNFMKNCNSNVNMICGINVKKKAEEMRPSK